MDDDDKVGYGRPPKHTRFRKGVSGNPKGRPKGVPNMRDAIRRAAAMKVQVKIGDRTRTMSTVEAVAQRLIQKALNGDVKAAETLIKHGDLAVPTDAARVVHGAVTDEDLGIVRGYLERAGQQPGPALDHDQDPGGGS